MNKKFLINGKEVEVQNFQQTADSVSFVLEGKTFSYNLISRDGHQLVLDDKSNRFKAALGSSNREGEAMVIAGGFEGMIAEASKKAKRGAGQSGGLTSPMPGKIFKVLKEAGSDVKKGEPILILEAMKMEHSIRADKDGKVKKIFYQVGELVQGGVTLAEVEA